MWGWGEQRDFDPNPHFFRYPSFTFYVHFLGQGLLYLVLKISRVVSTTLDYRVLYVLDATPFYTMGRVITSVFAVLTVWLTYRLGMRISGFYVAAPAAFLLAINVLHISMSQMVGVDVPLTFFTVLTLWSAIRLLRERSHMNYALAGISLGLAASTKYTGAFLVLPLLASWIFSRQSSTPRSDTGTDDSSNGRAWTLPLLGAAIAAVTFIVTSPFVILDHSTFWSHLSEERAHMAVGHFGREAGSTWFFYLDSITDQLLGWPLLALSVIGLIVFTVVRRERWALVLSVFAVPYILAVGSWSMKAHRYLLPVLPVLLIFAVSAIEWPIRQRRILGLPRSLQGIAIGIAVLISAIPTYLDFPEHIARRGPDTRTEAKRWIEENIPWGAMIAVEYYTPRFLKPSDIWREESDVRERIENSPDGPPMYAVQRIPMFQVQPERSEVFYDLSLYENVDVIVTSSGVKSRYVQDPERFERQVAFYDSLEKSFHKIKEFVPSAPSGPMITVYTNPKQSTPFGLRNVVTAPPDPRPAPGHMTGAEVDFLINYAMNFETFGFWVAAVSCYEPALHYPYITGEEFQSCAIGVTRCLETLGKKREAAAFLQDAAAIAPDRATARLLLRIRDALSADIRR